MATKLSGLHGVRSGRGQSQGKGSLGAPDATVGGMNARLICEDGPAGDAGDAGERGPGGRVAGLRAGG
jgi:hypothetical protein